MFEVCVPVEGMAASVALHNWVLCISAQSGNRILKSTCLIAAIEPNYGFQAEISVQKRLTWDLLTTALNQFFKYNSTRSVAQITTPVPQ